ncbi:GspE/PulE family protein [uncultured Maricaulis sp.]|uniref:GspE/PulE family protein n=1 Tax=uncultured Maricaulis sp. TaxID=174710 RepID=UPI0030D759B3|tara:strand:- start:91331 stop:92968 length:1638 start_codon:yes stop_codon:yes gene_type:complete
MIMLDQLETAGLTSHAVIRARAAQEETGEPLPVVISRLGLLPDETVVETLAAVYGLSPVEPGELPGAALPLTVTAGFLKQHRCLPLSTEAGALILAVVDPTDHEAVAGVRFVTGLAVSCRVIGFHAWRRAFDDLYGEVASGQDGPTRVGSARWTDDAGGIRDLSLDAPAVRLAESLMAEAAEMRASDIHIERKPEGGRVRFRIDGRLQDRQRLSPSMTDGLIVRLKVLGDLDVSDHRRAQDGRTALSARGRPIDARLSIIPSAHGESAVIRLLDRADVRLAFADLGFRTEEIAKIKAATSKPQGLFLVSGPTGGGKTTTLYAALNALRATDRKMVTVEDPIEYYFDDVHQTQLDLAADLSFANALRAFLRHDPDIILVGEIRDPDTARTAVQAALTGHLVLSTIHANDAASVALRLIEMGVEPYLLAATLTATTAQRLVRRLCPACAAPDDAPHALLEANGLAMLATGGFRRAVGCPACDGGYRGRMVVTETLVFEGEVAALTRDQAPASRLRDFIAEPLLVDGIIKASRGLTSVAEVLLRLEST